MSAPEGVELTLCSTDIVEMAALRGRARDLQAIAARRNIELPALGHTVVAANQIALCVRPDRWLMLTAPALPGVSAQTWQAVCVGSGAAVDLSSGLAALYLRGIAIREVLSRGCRLDLDPEVFPAGRAAATLMNQVSVIIAALSSGLLLLTPATTARHVHEWLANTARPFGFEAQPEAPFSMLGGDTAA